MTIRTLLGRLRTAGVRLRRHGAELAVSAKETLDPALIAELRAQKAALLELSGDAEGWWSPPVVITPEMLPLIGLERVSRHDDFFEFDGHSLLATRLVVRIKQEMEVEIALRDIKETP